MAFVSVFGSQELDIWVWVSRFEYLGLGLRLCISGIRFLGMCLRVWMSVFGSQDLEFRV